MENWLDKNHRKIARFLFLFAALVLIAFCSLTFYDNSIISIRYLGEGRTVMFYRELDWEVNRGTKFSVREGLKVVSPGCVISYEEIDAEEILLVSANSNDVIGLSYGFDHGSRQQLVVMYEFSSGRIWPCGRDEQDKNYLFEQLQNENPTLGY